MQHKRLAIRHLSVDFSTSNGPLRAVDDVCLDVNAGEVVGLVGESGSGKSVTSMSILQLLPRPQATISSGEIWFEGQDLLKLTRRSLRKFRGNDITFIFQEPMTALSPLHRIGAQLMESLSFHRPMSRQARKALALEWLGKVQLPDPERAFNAYPFELSGGQRQRVMIAMALMMEPKLLIADEPTTALDVTTQAQIFDLMMELKSGDTALLFITHDMGVVWELCDRVVVMKSGKVVEDGRTTDVLLKPQHSYTQRLVAAVPTLLPKAQSIVTPSGSNTAGQSQSLLKIEDLHTWYPVKSAFLGVTKDYVKAVNGVSMDIHPGEIVALVGESGCGKTTLGRTLLGLERAKSGSIRFQGKEIKSFSPKDLQEVRADMQMVFQDPYSALNPRQRVIDLLTEAMKVHGRLSGTPHDAALQLLKDVGLDESHLYRYPHEFSGGQRQRLCIARALGLNPKFIVFDEAVSALDVSIQAQVLDLLRQLRDKYDLAFLFITHDLSVVAEFAHRVMVMYKGEVVEAGPTRQVIDDPQHEYTRHLISAVPVLGGEARRWVQQGL